MRAWIALQQWGFIPFVVAVDRAAGSSLPANVLPSTVTANSLPAVVSPTSVASVSTQPQSTIPITPASFSPFPVPSDTPVPPNYPAVDPSQPPSVRGYSCYFDSAGTDAFASSVIRWAPLRFPISDLRGQPHTLRQRQR